MKFFCTLEMKIYSILDFKCTFEFDMKFEYMKFDIPSSVLLISLV